MCDSIPLCPFSVGPRLCLRITQGDKKCHLFMKLTFTLLPHCLQNHAFFTFFFGLQYPDPVEGACRVGVARQAGESSQPVSDPGC